jgi:hypothetical protein
MNNNNDPVPITRFNNDRRQSELNGTRKLIFAAAGLSIVVFGRAQMISHRPEVRGGFNKAGQKR